MKAINPRSTTDYRTVLKLKDSIDINSSRNNSNHNSKVVLVLAVAANSRSASDH